MTLVLVIQASIIIAGIAFLIVTRHTISRDTWLSFLMRDALWLLLTLDQISERSGDNIIKDDLSVMLQFMIVALLFYSTVSRYHYQRGENDYRKNFKRRENDLEEYWKRKGT